MKISIENVVIEKRFRKDMGDLGQLKKSMADVGLLQPICITTGDVLIFGERRLAAARELGWREIECLVIDLENPLVAEFDENECRKAFTPSEKVALAEAIENHHAYRLKEKQRESGGDRKSLNAKIGSPKLGEPIREEAKVCAAKAVGMGTESLRKAQTVVKAAADNPSLQPIVEEMDRTGKVDPAYKKVKEATQPKTTKPIMKASFDDWQEFRDIAEQVEESIKQLRSLKVPVSFKFQARSTCENFSEKFSNLAQHVMR